MAKELPYFKFEPSQWENGNIQICSFEAQGIFINVCSMYWQRLGELPYKLAVQKICKGNATAFDSLIEDDIIKVVDGMICIDFLNEQLNEFENTSKTNSENARLGWEKRRKNATAKRPQSEGNAIREDKIRKDESEIEIFGTPTQKFFTIQAKYITDRPCRIYETGFKDYCNKHLLGFWFKKKYMAELFWKENNGKMFKEHTHVSNVLIKINNGQG